MFWVALAANLLLRFWLASLPGYEVDVQAYKRWALGSALAGLPAAYETVNVDYPPSYLYVLHGIGALYLWLEAPDASGQVSDSQLLTLLIKLPTLAFDLVVAALLFGLVGGWRLWGRDLGGAGWGRWAALLYLWNPAVLWTSGYWGQPDAVHTAAVVGAVALMARLRWLAAGAVLAIGALVKPLAAPFVPLAAVAAGLASGWSGVVRCALGGLGATVLVFLPFAATDRLFPTLSKVLLDIGAMPYASVNAHSIWWVLAPWQDASAPWLAGIAPTTLGLALFLVGYAVLLQRSRVWLGTPDDSQRPARLFVLAAAVASWFFFVSTHMHENHLYQALPLLLAVAGRSRALAWLTVGCSVAILLNTTLHDPWLPYALPGALAADSAASNPHLGRPFTQLQLFGSMLNVLLVAAVALGTFAVALREGAPSADQARAPER